MKYSGINSNDVKSENRSKIIRLLNDKGDMARKDIATALGLTAAAVTQISNELLEIGILKENGEMEEEAHVGRKKIRIGLDDDFTKILGICIERNVTVVSVNNMRGKCLLKKTLATDTELPPEIFLEKIIDAAYELMESLAITPDDILGAGVSVPGNVSMDRLMEDDIPSLWNAPVPVRRKLERGLRIPVIVENNVNAFAIAELIYGAGREKGNFVFVKWGPGLGSAIAINNKVYGNQDGRIPELGHIILDEKGGTLESMVSLKTITEKLRESFSESETPELWEALGGDREKITTKTISLWGGIRDSGLEKILYEVMDKLALALYNASMVLPPDKIIYYGSLFELPYIRENFKRIFVERYHMEDIDMINKSTLGEFEDSIGAVAIVFNDKILKLKA
ncbi:ROK family protein [Oribacterium sp. P6A1]|uniref:ROK family protein n=1 Tax=Oribacterium sp. P6A1 TaxID=1410612 RepID=UPI00056A37F3|nr:ROK family protein [Oribacterium sp. P6A1]